jgi:hypothetical protein
VAVQIKLRRGTLSEWSSLNPILVNGEIVVETDTQQVKIGNGVSQYSLLPYGFEAGLPAQSFNIFF